MANYQQERENAARLAMEHVETLRALFKKHGIKQIVVTYDGYGDEGQLNEVVSQPPENWDKLKNTQFVHRGVPLTHETVNYGIRPLTTTIVPTTVEHKLSDVIYALLERDHPGWEINEGSFGQFVITPTSIHVTHNDRIEDVETTENEY